MKGKQSNLITNVNYLNLTQKNLKHKNDFKIAAKTTSNVILNWD